MAFSSVPALTALLVDDGVDGDGGLAGLAVADDQFALAAADRDQGVDGLEARLHRLMHRFARNDAGRLHVDAAAFGDIGEFALAVDGIAQRIDHAAQQALAHRHFHDGAGALDGVAFLDGGVGAENHHADIVGFEVQRHALDAAGKLDHLAGLDIVEAIDAGDAVADRQHLADFADLRFGAEILDFALQDRGNFGGLDIHLQFPLMAAREAGQLGAKGRIDHARAHLDDQAAKQGGIDADCPGAARGRAWLSERI